jgi:gamma-glutamyltranspeptidase/glutathione hydrolase
VTGVRRKRHDLSTVEAAVAAGHPATVEAGIEVLSEGGSAADAAVAASLASCVAETVMTGLLGGGHAIYFDASTGRARNLDCFVAVPGLGGERRDVELLELQIPFGTELVHYAIGIASCGVPGLVAGLAALHDAHGRLPWPRLVEPALRLARDGVDFPPAHASCLAMLAPVMTMNEGARIYSPGGELLQAGGRLEQPGLARALQLVAEEGPRSVYDGALAISLLELMDERGGLVTREDLRRYQAAWSDPDEVPYAGTRFLTREGLSGVPTAVSSLPPLRGLSPAERALALARTLDAVGVDGHTTNLTVGDADGNVCVLTTSLGLGSGDYLPGFDLHLNSMLGETDLIRGRLEPGGRMGSMMAPSLALDQDGIVLAAGAAGGTRLRGALLQVVAGIVDEGLHAQAAVKRPRLHPAAGIVHLEPGFEPEVSSALKQAGYEVRAWPSLHHYFGGVSVVGRAGAAGDPRRNGAAQALRRGAKTSPDTRTSGSRDS